MMRSILTASGVALLAAAAHQEVALKDLMPKGMAIGVAINQRQFDASVLSDEATAPGQPNFTGAFIGMACHDMSGAGDHADFDWFEYVERPYRAHGSTASERGST